jgi:hypothetical protein
MSKFEAFKKAVEAGNEHDIEYNVKYDVEYETHNYVDYSKRTCRFKKSTDPLRLTQIISDYVTNHRDSLSKSNLGYTYKTFSNDKAIQHIKDYCFCSDIDLDMSFSDDGDDVLSSVLAWVRMEDAMRCSDDEPTRQFVEKLAGYYLEHCIDK